MIMNQQEFAEFYDQNIDRVFRFVFLRVDTTETAQDLTAGCFLKLWQRFYHTADAPERKKEKIVNPTAFLFRIARNQIVDFYRQKSKKPVSLEQVGEIADFQTVAPSFIQKIELDLEMQRIKKVLQNIKPVYADVIIWHYMDDLSHREIAQILNKKEGTVRVLLHRAMDSLREQMKD